jgi:hypothetical protein
MPSKIWGGEYEYYSHEYTNSWFNNILILTSNKHDTEFSYFWHYKGVFMLYTSVFGYSYGE